MALVKALKSLQAGNEKSNRKEQAKEDKRVEKKD